MDGGFADLREINIPEDARLLSLRASFAADDGISFSLRDPNGRLVRSFSFPGGAETRELQWVETASARDGTWRFGISCQRRCEYAFGFYFHDAVQPLDGLERRYPDADRRFGQMSDGATTQTHEFQVADGTDHVALRLSVHAADGFSFRVTDPGGQIRSTLSFPDHVGIDDLAYFVDPEPDPGAWGFALSCDHECQYGFGFYFP